MEKIEHVEKLHNILSDLAKRYKIPDLVQPRNIPDDEFKRQSYDRVYSFIKNDIAQTLGSIEAYVVYSLTFDNLEELDLILKEILLPIKDYVHTSLDNLKIHLSCIEEELEEEEEER